MRLLAANLIGITPWHCATPRPKDTRMAYCRQWRGRDGSSLRESMEDRDSPYDWSQRSHGWGRVVSARFQSAASPKQSERLRDPVLHTVVQSWARSARASPRHAEEILLL